MMRFTLLLTAIAGLASAQSASPILSIKCGGQAYTASDGTQWAADEYWSGGDLIYTGYSINGTPDLYLYRSARRGLYGNFSYTIPLPNGSYLLRLRFAEIVFSAPGQRVFNVTANGSALLSNFDILSEVPPLTVDDKQFNVTVTNGALEVDVTGVVGFGILNGLQIFPGSAAPPPSPALSVSSNTLSFSATSGGSNPAAQSINISNSGGGTLNWSASNSQPWLHLPASSGTGAATLSIQPNIAGLSAGTYTDTITITAPGATPATATIGVTLQIAAPPPSLSVSPSTLTFGATAGGSNPAAQSFTIANTGGGTLNWSASNTQSWLHLPLSSGTGAATLSIQPNIAGLSAGTYTDTITVAAPGATPGTATVAVTLQLTAPSPSLVTSPASLTFAGTAGGANPPSQAINVSNAGGGTLSWTAASNQAWLSVSPPSGSGPGSVSISTNLAGLAAGTYSGVITITASGAGGSPQTIPVTLSVAAAPTASLGTAVLSLNCGASQPFTSADGANWSIDQYYSGGDLAYSGYSVNGTPDLYLYRTARRGLYGDFSYTIPVANGSYILVLKFAEIEYGSRGQRVFNVLVNGAPVLTNFDILAEVAPLTADDKQFPVTVTNGQLQLDFKGVAGRGLINAIQLLPAPPPAPSLSVSPSALTFSAVAGAANPPAQTLNLSNAGGGTLNWTASNTQSWLHLPSSSGSGAATLSIQPSIAGLAAGTYTDTITITSPGATPGTATVGVTLQVSPPPPSLSTSPATLTFSATTGGSNPAVQSINISNAGGGTLNWSASNTQSWLHLPSSSGTGAATLSIQPSIAGLAAGTYTDTVTITAPGATPGTATVGVTLQVSAAPPSLSTTPATLTFSATAGGSNPAAQSINISNTGGGTLNWTASNTQSWLHLPSSSGTGAATFSIQPNISGLSAGTYTDTITITAPGATPGTATIGITLQIAAPLPSLATSPASLTFTATAGGSNPAAQALNISNAGGGTLNWTASNTQSWIHLPSSSGSGAATLSIQPNIAGLSAGTYTDAISVTAPGATPGTATIGVTLQLSGPPPSLSTSPATLTFSATAGGSNPAAQYINISNTGSGTLNWTASNTQSWLHLPSSSGTGAATLAIQPGVAGLSAGTYTDTVTITAPGATPSVASISITFVVTAPSFTVSGPAVVSINCGGNAYTGLDGTNWAGDQYFSGGDLYYAGSAINGTQDYYLYRTARRGLYGDFSYSIPLANGTYAVTLKFAELLYTSRGQRVFNVLLNGSAALSSFDILAEVAPFTVDDKQFPVTVSNGTLRIDVIGVTGYGLLNAIQVLPATVATTTPPSGPTNTPPPTPPSGPGNSANTDQWTANANPPQTYDPNGGAVLYNGIQLPATWPPATSPTQQYSVPPYLVNRPAVIPIDTGRQLFVDDFLIDQTTLTRMQHQPAFYSGNPVLTPNTQGMDFQQNLALVYSDGVWFDPADQTYKMWYDGGYGNGISYATSSDGLNWTKPAIPDAAIPYTNIVLQLGGARDSTVVWMDLHDNPSRKFKLFAYYPSNGGYYIGIYFSPDGIHWSAQQPNPPNSLSDRTTVFYNPFRGVWVESARNSADLPASTSLPAATVRSRFYSESRDLQTWTPSNPANEFWLSRDDHDPPYPGSTTVPELYNIDGTPYESLLVGLFSWYYPPNGPDLVELGIGFTRDGFHWSRPTRGGGPANAFVPATDQVNTWNGYNTQSAGGGFLVVGDLLYIYFSGRNSPHSQENSKTIRSTGLAVLRRDGFYSMSAGAGQGTLVTHPLRFSGSHLFVNVVDPNGQLQAEVLDANGNVIPGFAKSNSSVIAADTTRREITWPGANLGSLAGQTVKFRFYLTNGDLYSFWVTSSPSGASNGYIAAGGPGFTSDKDQ